MRMVKTSYKKGKSRLLTSLIVVILPHGK